MKNKRLQEKTNDLFQEKLRQKEFDRVDKFECMLLYYTIQDMRKEEKDTKIREKRKKDQRQYMYSMVSRRYGIEINEDNKEICPRKIWLECMDEMDSNEGALIKYVHRCLPYSLINMDNGRELEEFIPKRNTSSSLSSLFEDVLAQNSIRSTEIVREYTSENTKRAYLGDVVYWQAWLSAIGFSFEEPLNEIVVNLFIIQHIEEMDPHVDKMLVKQNYKSKLGTHAVQTVERRIASLCVFIELQAWLNPCKNKEVRLLLSRLAKKYGKTKQSQAITKDILDDFLTTCKTSLIDIRDRALLLFAWSSGGRRRSEITTADMQNLTKTSDGVFVYNLTKFKANQTRNDEYKPIKGRATAALRDWLQASGVTEGAIFRSVSKGGKIKGALSGNDIRRIVKKRARFSGYDEHQFSAHSLRSGFTTEAGKQGKSLGDVMEMTGHRSVAATTRYYQEENITNNTCAELAG